MLYPLRPAPGVGGAAHLLGMNTQTLTQERASRPLPIVGQGATEVYPTDRYPVRVVKVSGTGHAIWVLPVESVDRSTGHEPARFCGGFPVWDHTYTDAELDRFTTGHPATARKATRRKDGRYCLVGSDIRVSVGQARLYRNYAD